MACAVENPEETGRIWEQLSREGCTADICRSLPRLPALSLDHLSVPGEKGIYIWWFLGSGDAAYVGVALNEIGLSKRILDQELNPNYIERRKSKFASAAIFQDSNGEEFTEKSMFRRKIADHDGPTAGLACVEYIKRSFSISFVVSAHVSDELAKITKKFVIKQLRPKFNIVHNQN